MSATLLLVPKSEAMPYYLDWFAQRKVKCPQTPVNGIFVAHSEFGPVCGVGIYQTDGEYFFLENFCANPHASKRLVYRAALFACEAAKAFGAMTGKYPLLSANSKGLARLCALGGFTVSQSVNMYAMPVVMLPDVRKALRQRAKGEEEWKSRTKTWTRTWGTARAASTSTKKQRS
jgi:hypothetical protein